jgi:hypothetical protein
MEKIPEIKIEKIPEKYLKEKYYPSVAIDADRKYHHVDGSSREYLRSLDDYQLKEHLFKRIINAKLYDSFLEMLKERYHVSDVDIEEVSRYLLSSPVPLDRLLATSYELKQVRLNNLLKKGELNAKGIINSIKRTLDFRDDRVGYHTSKYNISKKKIKDTSRGDVWEWNISGTEIDHRDNDLPMAYYSTTYNDIYREKKPKFIYLVSSTKDHRSDGAWKRALSLDIIDVLDYKEVMDEVWEEVNNIRKEKLGDEQHQNIAA